MASIVGEKYKYAEGETGEGWFVTDKIFGYMDETVNLYNKLKSGEITQSEYDAELKLRKKQYGLFGMPQPWGTVVLITGLSIVGFIIYKVATK